MAETSTIAVVISALSIQPSNYGTFISYTHMLCLLVVVETTSVKGIDVLYFKGYLSKHATYTANEQLLSNNQNYRCW